MARVAAATSGWEGLKVDQWEVDQPKWTETVKVMRHFQTELDEHSQLKLLCGGDLLESFAVPNLWAEEDVKDQTIYWSGKVDSHFIVPTRINFNRGSV